jgi:probable phosphoglycerate mutase
MSELWLIRHGETLWNAEGRIQGQLDIPLSPKGVQQVLRTAERLRNSDLEFQAIYSSDLERTRETASPIARALGLEVTLEPRLREVHAGLLQGLLRPEVQARYPKFLQELERDPWHTPRPEGESMADLAARVAQFLSELPEGRHLLITHGGVVRAVLRIALGLEGTSWRNFAVQNASITRILWPRGYALSVGDVAHLESWTDWLSDEEVAVR